MQCFGVKNSTLISLIFYLDNVQQQKSPQLVVSGDCERHLSLILIFYAEHVTTDAPTTGTQILTGVYMTSTHSHVINFFTERVTTKPLTTGSFSSYARSSIQSDVIDICFTGRACDNRSAHAWYIPIVIPKTVL